LTSVFKAEPNIIVIKPNFDSANFIDQSAHSLLNVICS
jgi:hypothetical protein